MYDQRFGRIRRRSGCRPAPPVEELECDRGGHRLRVRPPERPRVLATRPA